MVHFLDPRFIYILSLVIPVLGILGNGIFYTKNPAKGAKLATMAIWLSFVISFFSLTLSSFMSSPSKFLAFNIDGLAMIMNVLIFFVSSIVHQFSIRYMSGDSMMRKYFLSLSAITVTASVMVSVDNLIFFWLAWVISNLLLVSLMIHKNTWNSAKNTGVLTLKFLGLGSFSLLIVFILLYQTTGSLSIASINMHAIATPSVSLTVALLLMLVTAFAQSAQWPMHKWLLSSLNAPTTVSALMHAGLINAGGLLLVKFAPLFLALPDLLNIMFVIGAITAILGTFCKLIQTDIKKMLASSTMAQMGFMIMQCGLGLFPAAIAHLCWHGLFKSFLFLNAGSTLKNQGSITKPGFSWVSLPLACAAGLIGAYFFAIVSEKTLFTLEPTTFLVGFAFIAGSQLAYTLLRPHPSIPRLIFACVILAVAGLFYGASINFIEDFLPNLDPATLPRLHMLHFIVFAIFICQWLVIKLGLMRHIEHNKLWAKLYMFLLNTSQSHPSTITATRKNYQY
jgi:NAD(P)H-quinone oxidoreductase subunit 5